MEGANLVGAFSSGLAAEAPPASISARVWLSNGSRPQIHDSETGRFEQRSIRLTEATIAQHEGLGASARIPALLAKTRIPSQSRQPDRFETRPHRSSNCDQLRFAIRDLATWPRSISEIPGSRRIPYGLNPIDMADPSDKLLLRLALGEFHAAMSAANHPRASDPQARGEENHRGKRPSRFRRRWPLLFIPLAALLLGAFVFLFFYFPYSKRNVTQSLLESFPGELKVEHFELKYFPYPGSVAEGIAFRPHSSGAKATVLVTIKKMTIQASYLTLLIHPHYVSRIVLEGLRVEVPLPENVGTFTGGSAASQTMIGEVIANGAWLEIARSDDKLPLRFDVHKFSLGSVSAKRGMSYRIAMHNPEPPGEIESTGHIGPFPARRFAETPVSGSYSLDRANLCVYDGIAGLLSSEGKFSGPLRDVQVQGEADAPDFEVLGSGHRGDLGAQFAVGVNAVNGDVRLDRVDVFSGRTHVLARGSVAKREGWKKKFTSLDFTVRDGRIEDILRIFAGGHRHQSPMAGPTRFEAHVTVPPEGKPFLKEVNLDSDFDIEHGHFEHPRTQTNVDTFSEHSRGQKRADEKQNLQEKNPPENVAAHLGAHVRLRNGVARLTNVSFGVPGATAQAQGTYNVINQKIDFRGVVKIDANVSEQTGGIKSVFAKVLDPFFKKKHGSVVPVKMDGTYHHPHFALDLGGGKNGVSSNR